MICYRDMTFCTFYEDCANASTCRRPLTAEVIQRAAKKGLPISQFMSKPDCHSDFENERSDGENV